MPDSGGKQDATRRIEPAAAEQSDDRTAPRPAPQPSEDDAWSDVPRRIDRFTVLERVGSGGVGVVYAAYDPRLDRRVALKLLKPAGGDQAETEEAKSRFVREAKAMARLQHPNVLTVYDVGLHLDEVFLVLELVQGSQLGRYLSKREPDWREVVRLYRAAGRGLAAAHAVGLVHRDFKPANVLVGSDGRVRVMDFGLARVPTRGEKSDSSTASVWDASDPDSELTETGAHVGTPAYMAPEQHRGDDVDAKADQFSFCVSLYQGLYGQRPYEWTSLSELRAAVMAGDVRSPPADSPVPGWVRRVVMRGLAVDPHDRWSSMRELLSALDRDPRRRWTRAAIGAGALAAALGAGALLTSSDAGAQVCDGGRERFDGFWDETNKLELRAAFVAVDQKLGTNTWDKVETRLDEYVDEWADQHRQACEATEYAEDQSREVMHFKMFCLERHALELEGFVKALEDPDRVTLRRAIEGAAGLQPLDRCPREAFDAQLELAPDDETLIWLTRLRGQIAQARGLQSAGKYDGGVQLARRVVAEAEDLGHQAFEAEARLRLGALLHYAGDYKESETELQEAVWDADASRMDAVSAEAKTILTHVVGRHLARYDDAGIWGKHAQATLNRLRPHDEALEARLLVYVGSLKQDAGDYEGAMGDLQRALEIRARVLGEGDVEVGYVHGELGAVQFEREEFGLAKRHYERAYEIHEAVLGDEHPELAADLNNLGRVARQLGDFSEAQARFERAIEHYEAMTDDPYPGTGEVYGNLGSVLAAQGKDRAARRAYERGLELVRASLGADHPTEAEIQLNMARSLHESGAPERARVHVLDAIRIWEATFGVEHPRVAEARALLARLERVLPAGRVDGTEPTEPEKKPPG